MVLRLLERSPQWKILGGSVLTAAQVVIGAQTALYAGVLHGSYTWLSTLKDFAEAPTDSQNSVNLHKSIMADALCQDPLMNDIKQQLARDANQNGGMKISAAANDNDSSPSIVDWMITQGPEKVITDALVRAVAACHRRRKTSGVSASEN